MFIPDDPCRIVFWAYLDCLDAVEAQEMIEDEFNVKFSEEEIKLTDSFTMKELVELTKRKTAN